MCTMTWWRDQESYHVLFNRDELKTRSEALPPVLQTSPDQTKFLAPTDPDAGGTWLLTNEHGVTIALLNLWHQSHTLNQAPQSRGQLVLRLSHVKSALGIEPLLTNLEALRPFTIVALDHKSVVAYEWDGRQRKEIHPKQPLTSSSFRFPEVSQSRHAAYQKVSLGSSKSHWQYHRGFNDNESSAYTVRMCRDDAQTWSTSNISVGKRNTHWEYTQEYLDFHASPTLHSTVLTLTS